MAASEAPPADEGVSPLELGQRFAERYQLITRLGEGGMGTVYSAHDEAVDERVALKVLRDSFGSAVERFRQEVRLARRVTHKNAARTFDLGEHGPYHFITMELIEGESLHAQIEREGRLPLPKVVDIVGQICAGLGAAHAVGVIHRDLKPANVLIEPAGRAVITDFGIARGLSDDARLTVEGALLGTPAYVAPEQLLGETIDGRADLYAVGVILYEMLTGQRPFTGQTPMASALARLHEPPIDPREHADLPDELAALVLRCLEREPAGRPADASTVAAALQAVGDASAAAPRSDGPTTGSSFVTTSPGERALAVMPFRYRGDPSEEYLADALTDELVDLLSMTRGLRVLGSGATARFVEHRDAREIGRALGVEALVDGTVQRARDRVRISARVVEADTGVQRWSERFEGPLEDVFDLQDRLAKRVAEALRLELTLLGSRKIPAEAAELHLRARARAREPDFSGHAIDVAIEQLERCLALAPDFAPALAAYAHAQLQRWFLPSAYGAPDHEAKARAAVQRALEGAPGLAETHLAAARLAVSSGDFPAAAESLTTALTIAPTYAAAHEYLGFLQCEAGRSSEGVRHIMLAVELDPSLSTALISVLRHHAMHGDMAAYRELLERMADDPHVVRIGLELTRLRVAIWSLDLEVIRAFEIPELDRNNPVMILPTVIRQFALESMPPEVMVEQLDALVDQVASPRFKATMRQLAVEILAVKGARDHAIEQLCAADALGVLLDADWLDHCPALQSLRGDPRVQDIHRRVRGRADAIWRTAS